MSTDVCVTSWKNLHFIPYIPYTLECLPFVLQAIQRVQPDCIACDVPQSLTQAFLDAAARLPAPTLIHTPHDITCVDSSDPNTYAMRYALEHNLEISCYGQSPYSRLTSAYPDPHALVHIPYSTYLQGVKTQPDLNEHLKAHRLLKLSSRYPTVLVLKRIDHFFSPFVPTTPRDPLVKTPYELLALTPQGARELPTLCPYFIECLEHTSLDTPIDQTVWHQQLLSETLETYETATGHYPPLHTLKMAQQLLKSMCLLEKQLIPSLTQILQAFKGCVHDAFALALFEQAMHTSIPFNLDNLPTRDFSIEQVWGSSKHITFRPTPKGPKSSLFRRILDPNTTHLYSPPSPFSICSYPLEDQTIESFSRTLQKRSARQILSPEPQILPFSTSIEEGIDVRQTLRHLPQKKLFVKKTAKNSPEISSVILIFDSNLSLYPWQTSWIGEHDQESDMAFYATNPTQNVIGPGISRCQYGGFVMTYPPRRLLNIWTDPDYQHLHTVEDLLLHAGIDYALTSHITYIAPTPPSKRSKIYANRRQKKIIYTPLHDMSCDTLRKIQTFHVLDSHDTRRIADDYII